MRLDWNDDQTTFGAVLGQMLASGEAAFRPVPGWGRFEYGHRLDALLEGNGFFDAAAEDSLGPVMAAEMVAQIATLPVTIEAAASALLRPFLGVDLPRPLAVIDGNAAAVRFAPVARAVVWLTEDAVRLAALPEGATQPVDTLFAYPVGALDTGALDWSNAAIAPGPARNLWRVALAAELVGVLKGGLESVLAHVRERRQFGRPLGSFQAMQHRLAADVVQIDAARWLVLKAAQSGQADDALLALGHVQTATAKIVYDLHQFMGAMGLTLEHPLHRWTYRARMLRAAAGGAAGNLRLYADQRWGAA